MLFSEDYDGLGPACNLYVVCSLKPGMSNGCNPMDLVQDSDGTLFLIDYPQGVFVGCSAYLEDTAGNIYYFNFATRYGWSYRKVVEPFTAENFNPRALGLPMKIESKTPVEIVSLFVAVEPWPYAESPCSPGLDVYPECAPAERTPTFFPVIVQ